MLILLAAAGIFLPDLKAEPSYDYPTQARRIGLKNQIFSSLTWEQARKGVPEITLLSKKQEEIEYIGDKKDLIDLKLWQESPSRIIFHNGRYHTWIMHLTYFKEVGKLYGPFSYDKNFVADYVARWKEIQEKYNPDMLWMDDFPIYTRDGNKVRQGQAKPEIQYFDDQLRGMITGFMNHGAARGQAVYVNNKGGQRNWPDGVGCLEKDNLKMKVIGPKWQSCTTFGTSFGYLEGDRYKSIEDVMHEMIEVISRNGNFLVNIGPKADGTIPAPQVERLQAMGKWLKTNGAAIYGSRYWKVCDQENEHLAFTTKGKNLYAIKLAKPTKPFTIDATAGWSADTVKSVKLLGSLGDVQWQMTAAGLHITPPAQLGESNYAWSFEIVTDQEQHSPNVIVKDADQALKNTKQVDLEGNARKAKHNHNK